MNTSLVLTLIGADRPGLVEAVAKAVAEEGGNWVESRMARLAGKFAGVLRVEVPAERAGSLREALAGLKARGLAIQCEEAVPDVPETGGGAGAVLVLEVIGHDRPGIMRDVSRAIAQRHVNVIALESEVFSAAMSGEQMFRAMCQLRAPAGVAMEDLRASLEAIASELQVDITLEESASSGRV